MGDIDNEWPKAAEQLAWSQVTPDDIRRANEYLQRRRNETLARHAQERRALDLDEADIDTLERAIEVFGRKFSIQGSAASPSAHRPI